MYAGPCMSAGTPLLAADAPARSRDPVAESAGRARGARVYDALFGRRSRLFALFALPLSALIPPAGVGFTICLFAIYTGLPCPACGLTRSIACITHFQPVAAWGYHPFGPLVYALLVAQAISHLLGEQARNRLKSWFEFHGTRAHWVYWALVTIFLLFGAARIAVLWRAGGGAGDWGARGAFANHF